MEIKSVNCNEAGLDYLIANTGIAGRQILKIGRWLYSLKDAMHARSLSAGLRISTICMGSARLIGSVIIFLFIYYVGGSLTRSDQKTLACLNGLGLERAHRLTMINALLFGLPSATVYFLIGEGFHWVGELHSLAALPSWIAGNSSQLAGAVSLAVDMFRAADAALHKRCWAPFGMFPFLINLPTYMKMLARRLVAATRAGMKPVGQKRLDS